MAKLSIWNIGRANELIDSAAAVLAPALEKANIKTITVGGKPVAASAAPIADQISALIAVSSTTTGSQNENELMVTNSTLAAQLEKITLELATAQTAVGTLQGQVSTLTNRAEAAESAVQKLTAEKAQQDVQLESAKKEFTRVSSEASALNTELSQACIAIGCLQLVDANGAALSPNASASAKLEAANKISPSEKIKAYQGGFSLALSNIGLSAANIPGSQLKLVQAPAGGILAQYNAITDPQQKVAFYRKNADAIDAAYKAQPPSK